MRYNLKNRPFKFKECIKLTEKIENISMNSPCWICLNFDLCKWFKGFQKELRERLKWTPEGPESFFALIKEILGEA